MRKRGIVLLIALSFILAIPAVLAEQVLWDDDSDIEIYDTWKDIDGTPLAGASCSWQVYNLDGSLNQSGLPSEFSIGILNFTVEQLNIGIYPLLVNCTKAGYNGTSSKDSIKIVDELSEEYKDRLILITNVTSEINTTTQTTQNLAEEINVTTHATYDLLVGDINVTLTEIVTLVEAQNISSIMSNLTNISSKIDSLMKDTENIYDLLQDKWGTRDAQDIIDEIDDIKEDINDLEDRFQFISESNINDRLLNLQRDSSRVLAYFNKEEDTSQDKLFKWGLPIVGVIILVVLLVVLLRDKEDEEEKTARMMFSLHPNAPRRNMGVKK